MAKQPFPIEPVLAKPVAIRVVLRQFIELLSDEEAVAPWRRIFSSVAKGVWERPAGGVSGQGTCAHRDHQPD